MKDSVSDNDASQPPGAAAVLNSLHYPCPSCGGRSLFLYPLLSSSEADGTPSVSPGTFLPNWHSQNRTLFILYSTGSRVVHDHHLLTDSSWWLILGRGDLSQQYVLVYCSKIIIKLEVIPWRRPPPPWFNLKVLGMSSLSPSAGSEVELKSLQLSHVTSVFSNSNELRGQCYYSSIF